MKNAQSRHTIRRTMHSSSWSLSPEEDVIASIAEENEDVDDSLPADLWFRGGHRPRAIAKLKHGANTGKPLQA